MKKIIIISIFFFGAVLYLQAQKNSSFKLINNTFLKEVSTNLTNYIEGSGFTLVVFEINTKKKYSYIGNVSSNEVTHKKLDSIIATRIDFFQISKAKKGYYILPIIQIAYNEKSKQNDLNWTNNNSWQMTTLADNKIIPENAVFLKPLSIMSSEGIK